MPWRALRRTPAFTLAAVLLLAIGIGGTAVVYSVTDAVLLRRLAVARPGELARVVEVIPGRPPAAYLDWDEFEEWQARTRSFSAVFAQADLDLSLEEGSITRMVRSGILSPPISPSWVCVPRSDTCRYATMNCCSATISGDRNFTPIRP